ncbi:hypothetical protein GC173_18065 [bacterium]|nr:hypothetical protein [bacterium]
MGSEPQLLSSRKWNTPTWQLVAFAIASLVYIGHCIYFNSFVMDDALITFSYAKNIIGGHGARLTPEAEIVEGYSNPLWLLVILAFKSVGLFHPIWTCKILGILLGLGSFWIMAKWLDETFLPRVPVFHVAVPLLLGMHTPLVVWNVSGLENPLYTFLLVLGFYLFSREVDDRGRFPWSALAFWGVSLTRPEGTMYFVIAFGTLFLLNPRRFFALRTVGWLALFAVPWALYQWARSNYFGWPFPNTYYAKVGDLGPYLLIYQDPRGWDYVGKFFRATRYYWTVGAAALLAIPLLIRHPGRFLAPCFTIPAIILYVVYVGGDWMGQFRFMPHFSTLVVLLLLAGGFNLFVMLQRKLPKLSPSVALSISLVPLLIIAGIHVRQNSPGFRKSPSTPMSYVETGARRFNALFDKIMMQNPSVLLVDAGATAYFGRFEIVDLGKLADIHISRYHWGWAFGNYIFRERKPTLLRSQGWYTEQANWGRFKEELKDYVDVARFTEPGAYQQLSSVAYRDPMEAPETSVGEQVAKGVELVGVTLESPVLPSPGYKPFITAYWRRTAETPASGTPKLKLTTPAESKTDPMLHDLLPPAQWKRDAVYFEHRRLAPGGGPVSLQVLDGATPSGPYDLGTVGIDPTAFRNWYEGQVKIIEAGVTSPSDGATSATRSIWRLNELTDQAEALEDKDTLDWIRKIDADVQQRLVAMIEADVQASRLNEGEARWQIVRQWYSGRDACRPQAHELSRIHYEIGMDNDKLGDPLSLLVAIQHYFASLRIQPDFPLARRRIEESRPYFSTVNQLLQGRLYEEMIDPEKIDNNLREQLLISAWMTQRFGALAEEARERLAEAPEKQRMPSDPMTALALVAGASYSGDDNLLGDLLVALSKSKSWPLLSQLDPFRVVVQGYVNRGGIMPSPAVPAPASPVADFGPISILAMQPSVRQSLPNQVMLLTTVRRSGHMKTQHKIRMIGTATNPELLKQQRYGNFLLWTLSSDPPYSSLPKGREVPYLHMIGAAPGDYRLSVNWEAFVAGKSYFLNNGSATDGKYPLRIDSSALATPAK